MIPGIELNNGRSNDLCALKNFWKHAILVTALRFGVSPPFFSGSKMKSLLLSSLFRVVCISLSLFKKQTRCLYSFQVGFTFAQKIAIFQWMHCSFISLFISKFTPMLKEIWSNFAYAFLRWNNRKRKTVFKNSTKSLLK